MRSNPSQYDTGIDIQMEESRVDLWTRITIREGRDTWVFLDRTSGAPWVNVYSRKWGETVRLATTRPMPMKMDHLLSVSLPRLADFLSRSPLIQCLLQFYLITNAPLDRYAPTRVVNEIANAPPATQRSLSYIVRSADLVDGVLEIQTSPPADTSRLKGPTSPFIVVFASPVGNNTFQVQVTFRGRAYNFLAQYNELRNNQVVWWDPASATSRQMTTLGDLANARIEGYFHTPAPTGHDQPSLPPPSALDQDPIAKFPLYSPQPIPSAPVPRPAVPVPAAALPPPPPPPSAFVPAPYVPLLPAPAAYAPLPAVEPEVVAQQAASAVPGFLSRALGQLSALGAVAAEKAAGWVLRTIRGIGARQEPTPIPTETGSEIADRALALTETTLSAPAPESGPRLIDLANAVGAGNEDVAGFQIGLVANWLNQTLRVQVTDDFPLPLFSEAVLAASDQAPQLQLEVNRFPELPQADRSKRLLRNAFARPCPAGLEDDLFILYSLDKPRYALAMALARRLLQYKGMRSDPKSNEAKIDRAAHGLLAQWYFLWLQRLLEYYQTVGTVSNLFVQAQAALAQEDKQRLRAQGAKDVKAELEDDGPEDVPAEEKTTEPKPPLRKEPAKRPPPASAARPERPQRSRRPQPERKFEALGEEDTEEEEEEEELPPPKARRSRRKESEWVIG